MAQNEFNLQVAGEPNQMGPKKVNIFSINAASDGHVILECLYTNGQVLGNGDLYAYCASRYYISVEDLKYLRDTIDEHLEKLHEEED